VPPSLMEGTFLSLDLLDSNDLRAFTMMEEDSEQVLSANLSASLQLEDDNCTPDKLEAHNDIIYVESVNMTDSFDRIANNTLNEFCDIYSHPN